MMIEINLLPTVYKEAKKAKEKNFPLTLLLLVISGVLLAVLLVVSAINLSRSVTLRALDARLKDLAPDKARILTIQQKIANFKQTNTVFEQLYRRSSLWSKNLNILSDLIIPGIWLRDLSIQRELLSGSIDGTAPIAYSRNLLIAGTVISVAHDEMAVIGEFMRNLKKNKDFLKEFKNIKLEGVLRRRIATVEVMDFTLICYFKDEVEF